MSENKEPPKPVEEPKTPEIESEKETKSAKGRKVVVFKSKKPIVEKRGRGRPKKADSTRPTSAPASSKPEGKKTNYVMYVGVGAIVLIVGFGLYMWYSGSKKTKEVSSEQPISDPFQGSGLQFD
jgi:hypothetical protein